MYTINIKSHCDLGNQQSTASEDQTTAQQRPDPPGQDISELAILYILQKMKPGFHLPGQLIITEGKVRVRVRVRIRVRVVGLP